MGALSRPLVAVLLVCGPLLGGCGAVVRETWAKPGADRQEVSRDAADCERQARYDLTHGQEQGAYGFSVPRNDRVFEACMRARGYRPSA